MIDIPMVTRPAIGLAGLADPKFGSKQQIPPAPQARPVPQPSPAPRPAPPPPRPTPSPAPPPPRRTRQHPAPTGMMVQKGQKTSLTGMDPNLDLIEVGLGWDLGPGGQNYELDVEAFLLGSDGRVVGDDWFVFYNQPASPDGAVRLLDTGSSSVGDDASIQVRLRQLSGSVARITFIVTISEARERRYNFSNVRDAYVRIVDKPSGRELVRFNLTEYYNTVCSMIVGEIYQYKNEWRFNPVGDGTGDDLMGLCKRFGVNATD